MSKLLKLIIVCILLAGWAVAFASMHVLLYPPYLIGIVPKNRMSFSDTFTDVRTWTASDLAAHPVLVKRLTEAGKTHWLSHIAPENEIPGILEKGPGATKPSTQPTLPVRNLGIR